MSTFALNARDCEHGRQIGKCPECEVVQLERELAEQCRLNGMGSEREAKLMAQLDAANAQIDELKQAYYIPDYVPRKELADAKAEIAKLTECVVAADEMLNSNPHAIFAWTIERYDAARKQVTI